MCTSSVQSILFNQINKLQISPPRFPPFFFPSSKNPSIPPPSTQTKSSWRTSSPTPGINGAHRNHDPRDKKQVALMCPSCHARHDSPHRIAIQRRRKATATGQLWLLPELEWSPFASWEIPGWIYDRIVQMRLF